MAINVETVDTSEVTAQLQALDNKKPARLGWLIVLGGFCCSLLWAALAPLDKGVAVNGKIIVSGHRKVVQHPNGGIVDKIFVEEGQKVTAGEIVMQLNDTTWKTQQQSLYVQYITFLANQARLQAELAGLKEPLFSQELLSFQADPQAAAAMQLQTSLLKNRQDSLTMELQGIKASISGIKEQIKGLTQALANKQQQQTLINNQLKGQRELVAEGYMARNKLLDTERLYAQIGSDIAEDRGRIGQLQQQVAELTLKVSQRQQDYQKEVATQLTELESKTEEVRQKLQNAEFELAHTKIIAPSSGIVVALNVFTQGGVISPGQSLMEVVPEDESLLVEGELPVNLVDKVHKGLSVEVMFPAFSQSTTPKVEGEVLLVSADRLTDDQTKQPYYSIQIKVTDKGMASLKGLQIRPGMPVQAFVRTGERSLLSYLFKPLLDRTHLALGEE